VEDLVVVAGGPSMAPHEHGRRIVDHDLPQVSVGTVSSQLRGNPHEARASPVP
jgi:hypothetical protein